MLTRCVQDAYQIRTDPDAHMMRTESLQDTYQMYTRCISCVPDAYQTRTGYVPDAYHMLSRCVIDVYQMCTRCCCRCWYMVLIWYASGMRLVRICAIGYASDTHLLVLIWYASGTQYAYSILMRVPNAYRFVTYLVRTEQFADVSSYQL